MKKIVAMLLTVSMVSAIAVGCKKSDSKKESATQSTESQSSESATESSTEAPTSAEPEGTKPAEDPEAGTRATTEVKDGAYAMDEAFNDPSTFKWMTYTESGGDWEVVCENGEMVAKIKSTGTKEYSCQLYFDGVSLMKNAKYKLDFDIKSDAPRTYEWRFQLNGGDYHAYAGEQHVELGTSWTHVTKEFVMEEKSDPSPRFCFNVGNDGSIKDAHNIYIDNVTLVILDCSQAEKVDNGPALNPVSINQTGYQPKDPKAVFVDGTMSKTFQIVDANTFEIVYEGELTAPYACAGAGSDIVSGDFSDFDKPGTYFIRTSSSGNSYKFEIADDVYDEALKASILMLYTQRCGCEVKADIGEAYADFTHPACHMDQAKIYGTDKMIDVSGGWHDAGDYGRYVVPGAKTIADLFMTYQDTGYKADDLGIPESGNGVPDILDEARYELEWMFKMQAEDGGVYHKVTCDNFPATVMPEEETNQLLVLPVSTTATGDFAAVMAKASIIYKDIDKDFADKCLEASKKAYAYMEANAASDTTGFLNPSDVFTGEYPDAVNKDEFFWAAVELYLATGEDTYLAKAKELYSDSMELGLGWIEMGLYGVHSYLRTETSFQKDAEFTDKLKTRVVDQEKADLEKAKKDGYYNAMGTNYPWGSNLTVSNNGILYNLAYLVSNDKELKDLSSYQVDYIMGMNVCGYSFLTGFGTNAAEHPHHRPSQAKGKAVPGMVVGGPNGEPADPYAISVLTGKAPARCYCDNDTAYSINEVAIYWNSPFIYILAAKAAK